MELGGKMDLGMGKFADLHRVNGDIRCVTSIYRPLHLL